MINKQSSSYYNKLSKLKLLKFKKFTKTYNAKIKQNFPYTYINQLF